MKRFLSVMGAALMLALSSCTVQDTAPEIKTPERAPVYSIEYVRGVYILRRGE